MLAVSERFTNVHDNLFGRLNQPQRNWFFTAMIAQRTAEYKLNQIARHRLGTSHFVYARQIVCIPETRIETRLLEFAPRTAVEIECQRPIEIFFRVETAQTGTNHAIRFIVSIRSVHASEIRQTLFGSTVVIRLKRNQTIVELAQGIPKLFQA